MPLTDIAVSDVRALILDDNRNFQNLLRMLLRQLGFRRIEVFGDPEAAERHVREQAIDLAFVDYSMPKVTGVDWVRSVFGGAALANPRMAVVMVTGHAGRGVVEEAISAGIDGFLIKPLSPETLEKHVAAVLGRRRKPVVRLGQDKPVVRVHRAETAVLPPPVPVPQPPHPRRREPQRTVAGFVEAGRRPSAPATGKGDGHTFID